MTAQLHDIKKIWYGNLNKKNQNVQFVFLFRSLSTLRTTLWPLFVAQNPTNQPTTLSLSLSYYYTTTRTTNHYYYYHNIYRYYFTATCCMCVCVLGEYKYNQLPYASLSNQCARPRCNTSAALLVVFLLLIYMIVKFHTRYKEARDFARFLFGMRLSPKTI